MNISFGLGITVGNFCSTTICMVAQNVVYIINNILVPVLFAVAFIVFLYGIFKSYIWSHGDAAEVSQGHKLVLWGIIGFVVMISLWGLVNVVANTFGLGGYYAPPLPSSISPYGSAVPVGGSVFGGGSGGQQTTAQQSCTTRGGTWDFADGTCLLQPATTP
jgi:hypothetical protein